MKVKVINKSKYDLPQYETESSAGMDLKANFKETDSVEIPPLGRKIIKTGLFIELPVGYEAQVRPRSGLAIKHGITVLNSPGTIDADYRGEIGVILVNLSNDTYHVQGGDRIAQLVFAKHERAEWGKAEVLTETVRGEGGFGSTGVSDTNSLEEKKARLIEQAKKRFPIGTKFLCANTAQEAEITTGLFKVSEGMHINEVSGDGELLTTNSWYHCIFNSGEWVEIF